MKPGIYDIGTEIIHFQCFVTTDMLLFSISIIPEDLDTSRRDLAFGSVKIRFKAILKSQFLGLDSLAMVVFKPKSALIYAPRRF